MQAARATGGRATGGRMGGSSSGATAAAVVGWVEARFDTPPLTFSIFHTPNRPLKGPFRGSATALAATCGRRRACGRPVKGAARSATQQRCMVIERRREVRSAQWEAF